MSNKPTVALLHHTPLHIAAHSIRKCWDSGDKSDTELQEFCNDCGSTDIKEGNADGYCRECECEDLRIETVCGPKDRELINRVCNKFKHASTLEHLTYNFDISNISRALLQELARHRVQSLSVESTRYTMSNKLKHEESFLQELSNT